MNTDNPNTESNVTAFTADDLQDWEDYEHVRKGGRYNMFDPRARRATGLSEERYRFVLRNYGKLKAATSKPKP